MCVPAARILIADDSSVLRRVLREILKSRPRFKICGKASNGTETIEKAKELKPDLIILDLSMPDMNGFEAAQQIFKSSPSTPILIFSVHFTEELLQEARRIGIRGYIQKGENLEIILDGVDALLRGETFFQAEGES
jgi:two-component system, NarL family, response regulator NreC